MNIDEDIEMQMYELLAKVKKAFGDTKILTKYLKSVQRYFIQEYDYDKNTFEQDITDIANTLLKQLSYNKLSNILTVEELELVIAVTANEIESYYKGIVNG